MSEITCGIFVMTKLQGSFLLLTKRKNLKYDIPKGGMEDKHKKTYQKDKEKAFKECAFDELKQETGIFPGEIQLDSKFDYRDFDKEQQKNRVIFLGRLEKEREIVFLPPKKGEKPEHIAYKWEKWHPPHNIREGWMNYLLKELDKHFNEYPESKPF